jgi:hypothetical protein
MYSSTNNVCNNYLLQIFEVACNVEKLKFVNCIMIKLNLLQEMAACVRRARPNGVEVRSSSMEGFLRVCGKLTKFVH